MGFTGWGKIIMSSNKNGGDDDDDEPRNPSSACSRMRTSSSGSNCWCSYLRKLVKRVKRQGKMLCSNKPRSSFQCRYDPLSYSLNFDTTTACAAANFSSRFAIDPRKSPSSTLFPSSP